ncbi:uncharacterized protein LY79DRAFT_635947 [Colletotrichum navitas]|uniref:Uncharacterized protein n=1 Tax=Colletotrichum navitas TaxID=681940 RepID=A0AAD8PUP2_9PEZI|nr:uncharacterized protein LY79DRAFT_635947 [Colletotrichum navitas]KAK1584951.1 hypothetical protein LY79DRAFT_635947 [Colletotrichum navitas]
MRLNLAVASILTSSATLGVAATSKPVLSANAQSLFDYAMAVQDSRWDDSYKLIWYQDNGPWSVRFTAWYTAGLLHRNEGNDVENAKAAIKNVLASQLTSDYESAWYGTFKLSPDEPDPTPDSELYPPSIYNTYDPNWREFIGTQLIQDVELYGDLLGDELVKKIEDALEIQAVGAMRRNGSFPEGDNLILGYSNPNLMRALTVGWIGARRGNATFVDFANTHGTQLLELFQFNDTLGEYNAPNYYGMDVWALAANVAYGPRNATMTANAAYMLGKMWDDVAAHYNPYLGNLVGPYDRAYTRDMTAHSSILPMYWWAVFGRDFGPQPPKGEADLLYDAAQGAAIALVSDTVAKHISHDAAAALKAKGPWEGARSLARTAREELDAAGSEVRNVTAWVSAPLMVGGQEVAEDAGRGNQFVPAIVHWASDPGHAPFPYVGFFLLYPSASAIKAVAGERSLSVSYPNATQPGSDVFTFALSGIPPSWTRGGETVAGLEHLPCLSVNVSAPGLEKQPVTYGQQLRNHWYYNVSYAVPAGFEGVPRVDLTMEYTCEM